MLLIVVIIALDLLHKNRKRIILYQYKGKHLDISNCLPFKIFIYINQCQKVLGKWIEEKNRGQLVSFVINGLAMNSTGAN